MKLMDVDSENKDGVPDMIPPLSGTGSELSETDDSDNEFYCCVVLSRDSRATSFYWKHSSACEGVRIQITSGKMRQALDLAGSSQRMTG